MDYVRRAVWGMLYADDACIVSRSPQGLAKMMEVIVEVCRAFGLTVSAKKTETMCMPPPRTTRMMVRIEAAGQIYKQVQSFTYLGGAVTETPDMFVEIARRTGACWARIRRYSRKLYGQPKVALSLKTRMVKAEAIEPLLYGCSTWTLRQEHYAKLRTVHHRVLFRIIGAQRKRPDHRMTSYNRALEITGCESIETTLRTTLTTPRDPPSFLHRGTHPPPYTAGPTLLPPPLHTRRDPPSFLHRGTHPPPYTAGPTLLPTPRDPPPFLHRGTHPPPYTAGPTPVPTPRDTIHSGII